MQLADDAKIHKELRDLVGLMMDVLKKVVAQHPECGGKMAPALDSMPFDDLTYFGDDDPEGDVAED